MPTTIAQFKLLPFGYLTGDDLIGWCPPQLLIKEYEVDNGSIQKGCNIAYDEIKTKLRTTYNLSTELQKDPTANPDTRLLMLVKIASLFAIRNILGPAQAISEKMMNDFAWADRSIKDIRIGQDNLPAPEPTPATKASPGEIVCSSFLTLG